MKSPVASSSICTRSKAFGLKSQLKPSRVLFSAKWASRIRRATARSRRASACVPSSRSRKRRCGRLYISARASASTRAAGSTGIRKVRKWLWHRAPNWFVGLVVFAVVFFIFLGLDRFFQQRLVLCSRARGQSSLPQNLVEVFLGF